MLTDNLLANATAQASRAAAEIRDHLEANRCTAALRAFALADEKIAALADDAQREAVGMTTLVLGWDWLRRRPGEDQGTGKVALLAVYEAADRAVSKRLGRPATVQERGGQIERFACARLQELING